MAVTASGPAVEAPLRTVAEDAPIVAAVVRDIAGREWTLLPPTWRADADLCSGTMVYRLGDSVYRAACRERSAWACEDTGLCCRCFARLVDLGNSDEEND